jgi:hypothetical protein
VAEEKTERDETEEIVTEQVSRPTEFWFVELWYENSEIFKEVVKHIIIFGFFGGALEIFHRVQKKSQLPPEEGILLSKMHFYGYAVLLVIFGVSLIIKVFRMEYRGSQR